jgi:hypothetical protein
MSGAVISVKKDTDPHLSERLETLPGTRICPELMLIRKFVGGLILTAAYLSCSFLPLGTYRGVP